MDIEKAVSLENLSQYKKNTSEKIKSYVDTKTSVIQDGTKTVGGVSTDDYNAFKSAVEDSHIHSNKSVLDEINESVVKGGNSISGSTGYTVTDSVEYPLVGLKVFGKSTQDGTPTPENPVDIVSVAQPTVKVCGKNLLNPTLQTTTRNGVTCTNNGDGTYTLNGSCESAFSFVLCTIGIMDGAYKLIGLKSFGTGLELMVLRGGTWNNPIYATEQGTVFNDMTTDNNAVIIYVKGNFAFNNAIVKPMLTTDLTATYDDYEPYTSHTLTLPDTLNAIPVSSGGNVTIDGQEYIADYVDFERGVKVQRVKKIDLGSLSYNLSESGFYYITPAIENIKAPKANNIVANIVAEEYIPMTWDEMLSTDNGVAVSTSGQVVFANNKAGNPTGSMIYELATPIETPLSESELQAYRQLQTYNGVTNIINDKGAGLSVEYCTSKMLAEYALPLIKDLEAENAKKDEEISVLKTDILNNENKITELQNENSLNEKVKFLNNIQRTGKVYTVRFPLWETSQTCNGEKLDDNAGLVCNPSTATTRGISDYDNIPLFITYDCNAYVDEDGVRHITAIKGDENYRDTGKVDVFVLGTSYYEKSWVEDGYMYYSCTDLPRDGYVLASECKTKDGKDQGFALYPKCFAGDIDGKPYGSFGLVPARYCSGRPAGSQSISYSGNISYFHQRGSHYSGTFSSELKYITTRWWLKYGTRNSQSVMAGCTDYKAQYVATVAETGVKRIVIANANAAYFEVGMPVSIGDNGSSKSDRKVWACHNKAESATITAIEAYDDNNKAIYVDVDTAFDTTTTTYISTFHWRSGFSNKVLGRDGSPCPTSVGLTNGKYPAVIQGIECFVGIYDTVSNAIADIIDSTGKRDVYITNDSTKLSADITTIKSTYSKAAGQITPTSFKTWNYITAVDCDVENGIIVPTAAGQSGSSTTTGYADGLYCGGASSGQEEILCFGTLWNSSLNGVSCLNASGGLGTAHWSIGARLSING